MMFADAIDQFNPAWGWQLFLFVLIALSAGGNISQWFNSRRAQKRDVTLMEEFATRRELAALAEKVEDKFELLRTEMQEDKNEIVKSGETRVVKLHDRINDVLAAVSELRGEVHATRREDK